MTRPFFRPLSPYFQSPSSGLSQQEIGQRADLFSSFLLRATGR